MKVDDFALLEKVFLTIEYIKEKTMVDKKLIIEHFGEEVIEYLDKSRQVILTRNGKCIYAYGNPDFFEKIKILKEMSKDES